MDNPSLKAAIHKLPDLSFTISLKILLNLEDIEDISTLFITSPGRF